MKKFRHLLLAFCLVLGLVSSTSISQADTTDVPPSDITAKGAVLIDMTSGQILYEKNKDARLYPASITKIMTAILAIENSNLTDEVTTSQLARDQDGNRVYLEPGEQEPMEQMLYGLLINSGNDAAVAIAEHVGGSVPNFAKMMNKKAAELGAVNTHFVNPNGLHDDNHYTTPYDMALIANYAMKNAEFRKIVSTKYYTWHGKSWSSELVNLNNMLWTYDGAIGVKTGFTDQAQQTIVTAAKRGNHELLTVLMYAPNREIIHKQAAELLDYGFAHFTTEKIASTGDTITTFAADGDKVGAQLAQDVYATYLNNEKPQIKKIIHLSVPSAPFYQGFKVGTVDYQLDGKTIATCDLLSARDVMPPAPLLVKQSVWDNKYVVLSVFVLLLLVLFFYRRIRRMRRDGKFKSIDTQVF